MGNVYFDLTTEFNADGGNVVLSSGQAVVWYRLAMMSKDGDWIVRETEASCRSVLAVLARHGARYRAAAPLDVRWLRGGWSSHFEFADEKGRRVRCDFVSRPPRVRPEAVAALFARSPAPHQLPVVDLPMLLAIKQTQRAKDYPVIGALARLLPPADELRWTTDVERVLELAPAHSGGVARESVRVAAAAGSRAEVVVALAREIDVLQQRDRERMNRYQRASERYHEAIVAEGVTSLPLREAHARLLQLAEKLLPVEPGG